MRAEVLRHSPRVFFLLTGEFSRSEIKKFTASIPAKERASGLAFVVTDARVQSVLMGGSENQDDAVLAEHGIRLQDSDYIAVVSASGVMARSGFRSVQDAIAKSTPDVVYGDSVQRSGDGRKQIVLRPVFSPERLRCQNYLGDLVIYRHTTVRGIGGFRADFGEAGLFDLALRATRSATIVMHIPSVIFESSAARSVESYGPEESQADFHRALQEHLDATGGGAVEASRTPGVFDTRRNVQGSPLVSIVIPTRGTSSVLDGIVRCYVLDAVSSVMEMSTYENFEIVVVFDSVAEPAVLAKLSEIVGDRLRLVEWNRPFNFSEKMNFGVLNSSGDYILLLNDDIQVLSEGWIESLLALAQLPNAGMVGAMLYYDDDTIQHAGHAYFEGSPTHIGLNLPRGIPGPLKGYLVEREVSGVTAACALMPRTVFLEVGGFTSLLPGNFNDVDLCMKVGWKGHTIYWTPHAELYHFESKTRDAHVHYYELDVIEHRWGLRLDDPRFWPGHPANAV